jgi:Glycosyl transferases group 1
MRLAVLSNRLLNPWINWSTLGPPLLSPLSLLDDSELVAPPALKLSNLCVWREVARAIRKADTLFWIQPAGRPENPLIFSTLLNPRARRSAFVFDAFEPVLNKVGIVATIAKLNPCFVAYREAYEFLRSRYPRARFDWLPFGVDTDSFQPTAGDKTIFAYWMGRRYEPLHQALLKYCTERGLQYRSTSGGEIAGPVELGRLVARSKYFVVTPPNLDNPARTGRFSPLTMRYLEGIAAGTRLLGVVPQSIEFDELLPRDAILEVAPDGSDLAERLEYDQSRWSEAQTCVARARDTVVAQHSWRRRAEQIYRKLRDG